MTYTQWIANRTPPWLANWYGKAFLDSLGTALDSIYQAAIDAIKTRFIKLNTIDGLLYAGLDRMMPRATNETNEHYRARLIRARWYWSTAGTKQGLIDALADIGITASISEGSIVYGDNIPWFWFAVTITAFPSNLFTSTWVWGSGTTWGPARTWGGFDPIFMTSIQDTIRRFKPCYTYNYKIAVVTPSGVVNIPPVL